jgi:ammonium transporter, Amt family
LLPVLLAAPPYRTTPPPINTQYAAAVGMLTWNALEVVFSGPKWFRGSPSAVGAACGAVTGLVVITPAAGFVSNMWAFFFGFLGVIPTFFTPRLVHLVGVDDRLDCFAFHVRGRRRGSEAGMEVWWPLRGSGTRSSRCCRRRHRAH